MVKNWRTNRLSNDTSGMNLQPTESSARRTNFFWAGSCSVQLVTLPLKAVDGEYVHSCTYHISERRSGSISSLNSEKTSPYHQWLLPYYLLLLLPCFSKLEHTKKNIKFKDWIQAMLSKTPGCYIAGTQTYRRFHSSAAEVSTVTPLCGTRHVL